MNPVRQTGGASTEQTPALAKESSEIGLDLAGEGFAKESGFLQKRKANGSHRNPAMCVQTVLQPFKIIFS